MKWLLVVVFGCGSHAPPNNPPVVTIEPAAPVDAGPLDQDLDRLAKRSLDLLDELGRAFAGVGEDCGAATTRLGELSARYADVIAANAKVLQEGREMQLKLALRRFDDRFQAAAKAVMSSKTIAACYRDDSFTHAFDALAGSPPKG